MVVTLTAAVWLLLDICRRHFDIEGYKRDQLDDNMTYVRRSTRQRKFLYDTFDQSVMLDEPSVESAPQDKPREEDKEMQQPSEEHPPSDAEVAVGRLLFM